MTHPHKPVSSSAVAPTKGSATYAPTPYVVGRVIDLEASIMDALPTVGTAAIPLKEVLATSGLRRTIGRTALGLLVDQGKVGRIGTGHPGDPFKYYRKVA